MSAKLDKLVKEVQETQDAQAAAIALIGGLADQIRSASDDEAALNKLADDLDSSSTKLAGAVLANTPHRPSGQ